MFKLFFTRIATPLAFVLPCENKTGGAGDADEAAALEEELKEYLLEDAEQHAALPDNDDEDWGSGSHQTENSTGTADDDEGSEGHNYERVQ